MKKLKISDKEFIRRDGLYYNLTDLFRLTTLGGISLEAWDWAKEQGRTREISRRGWFMKKSWGKAPVLIEYAKYLTPGLYTDVLKALNMDDPDKLIAIFGEFKAAKLDYRVAALVTEKREASVHIAERARFRNEIPQTRPTRKVVSMQAHRDGRTSIQHSAEPDVLTQVMMYNALTDTSSSRHDVCHTPSYSSSSHSSHSWSGDSGSSDSGGGGCD